MDRIMFHAGHVVEDGQDELDACAHIFLLFLSSFSQITGGQSQDDRIVEIFTSQWLLNWEIWSLMMMLIVVMGGENQRRRFGKSSRLSLDESLISCLQCEFNTGFRFKIYPQEFHSKVVVD